MNVASNQPNNSDTLSLELHRFLCGRCCQNISQQSTRMVKGRPSLVAGSRTVQAKLSCGHFLCSNCLPPNQAKEIEVIECQLVLRDGGRLDQLPSPDEADALRKEFAGLALSRDEALESPLFICEEQSTVHPVYYRWYCQDSPDALVAEFDGRHKDCPSNRRITLASLFRNFRLTASDLTPLLDRLAQLLTEHGFDTGLVDTLRQTVSEWAGEWSRLTMEDFAQHTGRYSVTVVAEEVPIPLIGLRKLEEVQSAVEEALKLIEEAQAQKRNLLVASFSPIVDRLRSLVRVETAVERAPPSHPCRRKEEGGGLEVGCCVCEPRELQGFLLGSLVKDLVKVAEEELGREAGGVRQLPLMVSLDVGSRSVRVESAEWIRERFDKLEAEVRELREKAVAQESQIDKLREEVFAGRVVENERAGEAETLHKQLEERVANQDQRAEDAENRHRQLEGRVEKLEVLPQKLEETSAAQKTESENRAKELASQLQAALDRLELQKKEIEKTELRLQFLEKHFDAESLKAYPTFESLRWTDLFRWPFVPRDRSLFPTSKILTPETSKLVSSRFFPVGSSAKLLFAQLTKPPNDGDKDGWHPSVAKAFHSACDGRPKTLSILEIEDGRLLLAFADKPWGSSGYYVPSEASFVLFFDPRTAAADLFKPRDKEAQDEALYHWSGCGPDFGGDDLVVLAELKSDKRNRRYLNEKGQDLWTALPGREDPKNSNFKWTSYVKWEVWELLP